jgi:Asp-tRNA(Asn)/Glu-tRNA(Gln) amidotransferase A subunit family amidase
LNIFYSADKNSMPPAFLTSQPDATSLRASLQSGTRNAESVCEELLAEVATRDPQLQAFEWLEPKHIRQQAQQLDAQFAQNGAVGPAHGLPLAFKDIIDTAGIPTKNGTVLDEGRIPTRQAAVVARWLAAGGVLFGKTVTTELAFMCPARTFNPHGLSFTPGGSSAGSAAAVAAGMVPIALGSQTGGSVIRPAAFCGVFGFKPTFNLLPRDGVLMQSHTLDTLGVFARSIADLALVTDLLQQEPVPGTQPTLSMLESCQQPFISTPRFGFITLPHCERTSAQTLNQLDQLRASLGTQALNLNLPTAFQDSTRQRETLNFVEMVHHYGHYAEREKTALSSQMQEALEQGRQRTAVEYLAAVASREVLNRALEPLFAVADVLVMLSAPDHAPENRNTTGDPIFNGIWTLCGTPSLTLPLFQAKNGMPIGVQLVAPRGADARLLRVAQWLWEQQD